MRGNMTKKEVMIALHVLSKGQDGEEVIEFETGGYFEYEEGHAILSYQETEVIGTEGIRAVVEVFNQDRVSVTREGEYGSQLLMSLGKRNVCQYSTEFGVLMLGVSLNKLKNELSETGGKLRFAYTLDVNLEVTTINEMEIRVRERGVK